MGEHIDIVMYIILGINLLIALWLLRGELRLKKFMRGKNAHSLEGLIVDIANRTDSLDAFQKEAEQAMALLNEKILTSIRGVGLVRFNPFKGTGSGGDQSFAVALIDVDGNGVIISSLYTRDRVSTYAKPVHHFSSTYKLSEEEEQALQEAKKRI